ncbi:FCS-Like Zinc finger 8-like [Oryza glaberrima]|uniref:FLZ-type domain-containing protein n=1 Tax=Oryza glaberrima TaxID=4538 RepID=I1Q8G9_ORYGL|nr:FCS-Like Zinc finger 8-like [Oryza glaberrima]
MLKKRCDLQAPSPVSSELANGGGGLLSPRSSSSSSSSLQGFSPRSIFSVDDQAKNHPCASPRNPLSGGGQVTGLAGVLVDGEGERRCYGRTGRVLLGMMRLRVQLPQERVLAGGGGGGEMPPPPSSPIEFGVKNRDAQLALLSPVQRSPLSSAAARAAQGEAELAEDYTCVIARGPNPKMTHIFDDLVVESSAAGGDGGDACRLFMQHRDEKAFCSSQCRYHEVLFDKRIDEASDVSFKLKN